MKQRVNSPLIGVSRILLPSPLGEGLGVRPVGGEASWFVADSLSIAERATAQKLA